VSTDNGVSAIHDRAIRVNCELLTQHTRRIIAPAAAAAAAAAAEHQDNFVSVVCRVAPAPWNYVTSVAVSRWGRGTGAQDPQIVAEPLPKFSRTLDTLWSIDSQKS